MTFYQPLLYSTWCVTSHKKFSRVHVGMETSKTNQSIGDDTTTLSHHPYILCHFAATYTICFVFVSFVQRRVVEGSGVGSGECVVHFDVHGE